MARWRQATNLGEGGAQAAAEAVAGQQATAAALAEEEAMLRIPAEAGWDPLDAEDYAGSWVSPNPRAPLAILIPDNSWRLHAVVGEGDVERVRTSKGIAQVRVAGRPELRFQATIERMADDASQRLPSEALGKAAGGPITTDPTDPARRRSTVPLVDVWLAPEPGAPLLRHGQRVDLRLGAPPRPLAWQAATAVVRLLDPQSTR